MNFYTQEQIEDKHIGNKGTDVRKVYDEEIDLFLVGEAIRQARQTKQMTQKQLGDLVGVQKSQISRLERGKNLTLSTITRLFRAMDLKVSLDISNMGRVGLC